MVEAVPITDAIEFLTVRVAYKTGQSIGASGVVKAEYDQWGNLRLDQFNGDYIVIVPTEALYIEVTKDDDDGDA